MAIIELKNATKIYGKGEAATIALSGVDLKIENKEFIAIMGPSGSGKTTMLNILGCLDVLTSGDYLLQENNIKKLSQKKISLLRSDVVSFVFQHFELLNDYTVYENVELPLLFRKKWVKGKKQKITDTLENLNIQELAKKRPNQISGGQRQRVAIARALVSDAEIILADEPTGALDQTNGKSLLELLRKINETGKTVIIITHDPIVASYTNRIIRIEDGKIVSDEKTK